MILSRFRPLSSYEGVYHVSRVYDKHRSFEFPSPLEVNRFISLIAAKTEVERLKFPSTHEVYRFISNGKTTYVSKGSRFPSPLEVDRFISHAI